MCLGTVVLQPSGHYMSHTGYTHNRNDLWVGGKVCRRAKQTKQLVELQEFKEEGGRERGRRDREGRAHLVMIE